MAYEVLARKWRPQQFDEVVGQEHVTRTLKNAIASGRVAHAYLFVGPRGIGKTSLSRILAKALNCEKGRTDTPCGVCPNCVEIAAGSCLDVIEFDAASHTQVDKVREIIIDNVRYAPSRCRTKVYIVDEVHMLSAGSFNALLKTLEEPPPYVQFIFATTESHKVPATIVSRCQRFDLRRISSRDIVTHLAQIAKAEKVEITRDALLAIARGAEGGMRDAESALDQLIAFRGAAIAEDDVLSVFGLVSRKGLEDLVAAILEGNLSDLIRQIDALDRAGKDMQRIVVELLEYFRNLLVVSCAPDAAAALDILEDQAETLRALAGKAPADNLLRMADILVQAENRIRYALSRKTLLETALIRCSRAATTVSIDDLLAQIHALKEMLSAGEAGAAPAAPPESRARPAPAFRMPAAEAPAAVAAGPDLQALRLRWPEVIEEAARRVTAVKTMLLHGRPVALDAKTVAVGFDPAFAEAMRKLAGTPRCLNALRLGLHEVLRRTVAVELRIASETEDEAAPAAPAGPVAARRASPIQDRPAVAPSVAAPAAAAPSVAAPAAPEPGAEPEAPSELVSRRDLVENPLVQTALRVFKGRIIEIQQGRAEPGA
jgi:DNA polymerase-3 subunit gamma/tau